MTQLIEIIIATNGQTKIETKGFAGASCREGSRFIEDALGRRVAETLKSDFHQELASQATNQQRS